MIIFIILNTFDLFLATKKSMPKHYITSSTTILEDTFGENMFDLLKKIIFIYSEHFSRVGLGEFGH